MSLRQDPLDWWGALDGAVLHALAEARGPLTLAEIGAVSYTHLTLPTIYSV